MGPRIRLRRIGLCVVLVALAVVGAIGLSVFRDGASPSVTHERDATPLGPGPTKSLADHPKTDVQSAVASSPRLAWLTPADVMGNPDCIMRPGAGNGRDLAMVVVPGEDGSRFAVVDGSGRVFGDTLPFRAVRDSSFARREDGSVVAGFGGSDAPLRRNFPFRAAVPPFSLGVNGVVVYQDGQVIYENGEASRFGLADDGSSFYVMEPMAGNVSRLVIRNLDLGPETHHDLANLQAANDGIAHVSSYTIDQSEVVIQPFLFFGGNLPSPISFFPTDGGEPRQVSTDVRGLPVFVSSNEGYFGVPRPDGDATVKRVYRYDDEGVTIIEGWSRNLGLGPVSGDGAWLVGRRVTEAHVLDASTGETVFVHPFSNPVDYSVRIHDGRLVLGHGVGDPEDIARCLGKREVVRRTPEDESDSGLGIRRLVNVTDERACFADLRERGLYRTVYDVYDLRTLANGGSPDHYRVEYGEKPHCGSGDDPFGTLEVRDGQLVYVPRT